MLSKVQGLWVQASKSDLATMEAEEEARVEINAAVEALCLH